MLYNNINRTTTPLILCATRWDFFTYGVFYVSVSKTIINNRTTKLIKYYHLSKEILISKQARDRLLSKLMSGELEVLE